MLFLIKRNRINPWILFLEPYSCTGNFQADFTELCRRTGMATIPAVVHRARPPTQAAPESSKPEKGKDKGKSAITEPEPEPELDTEGGGCLLLIH